MILLIEDRTERQNKFKLETDMEFNKYKDILDNKIGKEYEKLFAEFKDNNYNLEKYTTIITHRSAFLKQNSEILDRLKEYCKKEKKTLVFFSGGISNSIHLQNPFEFLLLNSKTFYSDNLKIFLEDYRNNSKSNILILEYGKYWSINLLLNKVEKINMFIANPQKKEEIQYEDFIDETNIRDIEQFIQIDEPPQKNGWVNISDLKSFALNITKQIKKRIVLEA